MKTIINQFCKVAALTVLCFLWLTVDNAYAFVPPIPEAPYSYSLSNSGNKIQVSPPSLSSTNATAFGYRSSSTGHVYTAAKGRIPMPGMRPLEATVESRLLASKIAPALGRFFGKAIPILAIGVAAYDFAKELGIDSEVGPDGVPVLTRVVPGVWDGVEWYGQGGSCRSQSTTATCNCLISAYPIKEVISQSGLRAVCQGKYAPGPNWAIRWDIYGTVVSTPSSTVVPVTVQELVTQYEAQAQAGTLTEVSALGRLVRDMALAGETFETEPSSITGPASLQAEPKIVVNPDGSTKTTTKTKTLTYDPEGVTVGDAVEVVDTDELGNPTGTTTSTEPADLPQTCGLPGTPACKIDETGTPQAVPSTKYDTSIDAYKQTADANRSVIAGAADKPFFTGWAVFFNAPPVAECVPYALPQFNGSSMGAIDPCGVVGGVRVAMAYIWALAGLYLSLGMIRKVA